MFKLCSFESIDDTVLDIVVDITLSLSRLKRNIKQKDILKNIDETKIIHEGVKKLLKIRKKGTSFPYTIKSELSGIIKTLSSLVDEPREYKGTELEDLENTGYSVIEGDIEFLKYGVLK
jgi:hypothetical protein